MPIEEIEQYLRRLAFARADGASIREIDDAVSELAHASRRSRAWILAAVETRLTDIEEGL